MCSVAPNSFAAPWTAARQAPPWDFSGKNTGVGLPVPPPGDLLDPEIEPVVSCIGRQILHH